MHFPYSKTTQTSVQLSCTLGTDCTAPDVGSILHKFTVCIKPASGNGFTPIGVWLATNSLGTDRPLTRFYVLWYVYWDVQGLTCLEGAVTHQPQSSCFSASLLCLSVTLYSSKENKIFCSNWENTAVCMMTPRQSELSSPNCRWHFH